MPFSLVAGVSWACEASGIKKAMKTRIIPVGYRDISAELSDSGWCGGVCYLGTLSLTGCTFPVVALSRMACMLGCLRSLTMGWCNLLSHPRTGRQEPAGLIIESASLVHLRFWKCAGSRLTIAYVPGTGGGGNSNMLSIKLRVAAEQHVIVIHGALGPPFKRKRRESLHNLTTLGLAALSLLPALLELRVSQADNIPPCSNDENLANSWCLPCVPVYVKDSLTNVVIKDYRGGDAELAVITRLLKAARNQVSVTLHHDVGVALLLPQEAIAPLEDYPRASKKCAITVAEVPMALSPLESLLCSLCLITDTVII